MNVIQRLLIRDDIDALELDLARAREIDPGTVPAIREEIARLERLINRSAAQRQPACSDGRQGQARRQSSMR